MAGVRRGTLNCPLRPNQAEGHRDPHSCAPWRLSVNASATAGRKGTWPGKEEGAMQPKKLVRLYREEQPAVRCLSSRKRALGTRAPKVKPEGPNQCWSTDFLSDALIDGRRLRILTVGGNFHHGPVRASTAEGFTSGRLKFGERIMISDVRKALPWDQRQSASDTAMIFPISSIQVASGKSIYCA